MKHNPFKFFSLSIIWLWLICLALIPFCLIILASFLSRSESQLLILHITLQNYLGLIHPIYLLIFWKSIYLAGLTTLICLFIGYPFAYILAKSTSRYKNWLVLMVIIPLWTSSLVRSYAMMALLKTKGLVNTFLLTIGLIHSPLQLLYTNIAVVIGLVYNLLPFMILPLYSIIERMDNNLIAAALDLGASKFTIFRKVIIPLTIPGILSGSIIVFLPAMTLFYIPDILGGAKSILLGNLIEQQFLFANNWPFGSAISIVLTFIMAILIVIYWRNTKAKDRRECYETK